jgi:general secretion pathway protein E
MNKSFKEDLEFTKQWAKTIGLPFEDDFSNFEFIKEGKKLLPLAFCRKHCILPLGYLDNYILVAIANPYKLDVLKEIRFLLKTAIKEVLATKIKIEDQINKLYQANTDEIESGLNLNTLDLEKKGFKESKEYDLLDEPSNSSVISLLNNLFIEALHKGASDIHFEPASDYLIIKYRIDGILREVHKFAKSIENQIIARLKVQAELDIAESRMPQDGRIKLKMGSSEIDFRLSTVPVIFGERLVLRISDNSNVLAGLEQLDLREDFLASIKKDIRKKQGIILITGPTGSGKTRTLYSILSEISSSDLNIMTIEDPVENKLKSMAQINVNHKRGLTFSKGLRHILRQDPDIIMVGEIRDKETVSIAIEASLTGHLVLSTLHTNDAPSTIIRLIDMGIEPYLISSSLISVCSQRLIRKLCTFCNNKKSLTKNCKECSQTGYKGRRGIYEYMPITKDIKAAITKKVDAQSIFKIAEREGLKTLYDDGLYYVNQGITTLEEIERVTNDTKGE